MGARTEGGLYPTTGTHWVSASSLEPALSFHHVSWNSTEEGGILRMASQVDKAPQANGHTHYLVDRAPPDTTAPLQGDSHSCPLAHVDSRGTPTCQQKYTSTPCVEVGAPPFSGPYSWRVTEFPAHSGCSKIIWLSVPAFCRSCDQGWVGLRKSQPFFLKSLSST